MFTELDAPGKDESPARDVPSLFGALGLVKRPSKAETTRLKSEHSIVLKTCYKYAAIDQICEYICLYIYAF